ncbi:serine protease 7-like [Haematobia irritans]|uniref:serine protease 7-like n=1 Tax=Haematobia irritans TaxID=7368 RepID=UPI003F4F8F2D
MIKRGFYFAIFLLILGTELCWSQVMNITGVQYVCRNPDGRVGRCTSKEKCHHYAGCNQTASIWECPMGRGSPPYVCCIFGKNIIFPDDDSADDRRQPASRAGSDVIVNENSNSIENRTVDQTIKPMISGSKSRGILFPDENGNFLIPTPSSNVIMPKLLLPRNNLNLFPTPPICGPSLVGDKIHGGVEAMLGQFPWLVNLEYRNEEGYLEIGCSGNILNHRYVVTAAHCVKGLIEELLGHLESLRVGDHNTALDKDCDDTGCIDPYERFNIIERIVHERYRETKKGRLFNDIALLKTDRNITYSFSVAPICLPAVMGSMPSLTTGARLTVAGWGNNGTSEYTDEKRIVDVPYVENLQCAFRLQDSQICAGGETGKDSCTGDSGGSLARRNATAWVLEGIVSFGRECGTSKHAIYTRVRDFIPWILEKVVEP